MCYLVLILNFAVKYLIPIDRHVERCMGDTVVGVSYRPPDQEEEVDESFYRQLEVAS